jgi:hypothetical protein
MARTMAAVEDLKAGNLPRVCAKTGEPADGYATLEFRSTPGWTWILLLFGILPFLIAHAFATVRFTGILPMSDRALERAQSFRWTYRVIFALAVVEVVAALLFGSEVLAWAGAAVFFGGLLYFVIGAVVVWPNGRVIGDWVSLSFVHPRFAEAVDRWYGGVNAGR